MTKETTPAPQYDLYDVASAAAYLGMHPQNIKHHVYKSGKLKRANVPGKRLMFTRDELDRFRDQPRKPGPPMTDPDTAND